MDEETKRLLAAARTRANAVAHYAKFPSGGPQRNLAKMDPTSYKAFGEACEAIDLLTQVVERLVARLDDAASPAQPTN